MPSTRPALVFDPGYDFELPHFESSSAPGNAELFDGRRASRALAAFEAAGGRALRLRPEPVTQRDLGRVHTSAYLERLNDPASRPDEVAAILEIPAAARAKAEDLDQHYLAPMRLGTGGTLSAVRCVLGDSGTRTAINLSGGYHHAMADGGSGFCAYNDLGLAAELALREFGLERILCIDLDAHQGNGTARIYAGLEGCELLDLFNREIWPGDEPALAATRHACPLPAGTGGPAYLASLDASLGVALAGEPQLVLYNAGSDALEGDPLGGLALSLAELRERDRRVLAASSGIPLVATASGGYTAQSHLALAGLLLAAAEWG